MQSDEGHERAVSCTCGAIRTGGLPNNFPVTDFCEYCKDGVTRVAASIGRRAAENIERKFFESLLSGHVTDIAMTPD